MSHIESAKAEINKHLAEAYVEGRSDPIMHHSSCKEALAVVVRLLADPHLQKTTYSLRMLQELASKTLAAIEKVEKDEPARLD